MEPKRAKGVILMSQERLVMISNAEPYAHKYEDDKVVQEKQPGGLTTGLDPMMQQQGDLWLAWGREEADFEVTDQNNSIRVPDKDGYKLKRLKLTTEEVEGFYYGFSNRTLWPICHNFITKANFSRENWRSYQKVNQKYAEAALEEISGREMIWVQDYQLCLVPGMIREEIPEARLGFFWHIPWPPYEIFNTIPWREELLEGLLASDLIGFHTRDYVDNFLNTAAKNGMKVDRKESLIEHRGNITRVRAIPLGIDYQYFFSCAEREDIKQEARQLREHFAVDNLIIGIDRLDYTKGIFTRLQAVDRFFEKYPEYRGEVSLVQRVSPSRTSIPEYKEMRRQVARAIGDINGRHNIGAWEPIRYFKQTLPQEELIPYYLAADLALVTPLVDGLNLVSKEYLASREKGQLILSEFAGVKHQLPGAIVVNPHNFEEIGEAIRQIIEMPEQEKERRYQKMIGSVKSHDINWWRETFLKEWRDCYE